MTILNHLDNHSFSINSQIINDVSIIDTNTFILFPFINSVNVFENSPENITYQWQTFSGIESFSFEKEVDTNFILPSTISLNDNSIIVAG